MEFKTQEEYEKEKAKWKSSALRNRRPAGYDDFKDAERSWLNRPTESKSGSKKKGSGMKIKSGNGNYYKGKTMKIKGKDAEFTGFEKIMSGKKLTDPGKKFSKKKTFKRHVEEIGGKHYDKKGNLIVPKFKKPKRVKLSKKQRKANKKLDKQFDKKGFYKTDEIKMPTKNNNYKDSRYQKYAGQAKDLASRMGISSERNTDKGADILKSQASRYNKTTSALTIPDFSLSSTAGQNMLSIGKKRLNTKGMRT